MLILKKIKSRLQQKVIRFSRSKWWFKAIYLSYWHYKLDNTKSHSEHQNYYTAVPNRGAGIGHQLANWIAGYWYAQQYGLLFAHTPFATKKWDKFLGFGEGEQKIETLLRNGYKKVKLPLFDEFNEDEVTLNKCIIASYKSQKVVFVAEQDQFYRDQFGVIDNLKIKFHGSVSRGDDQLRYSEENFNIAIHVRRGDIVIGQSNNNENLLMRWLDSDYFLTVLSTITNNINSKKPIAIYLFSQGTRKDFIDFEEFENIHFCLDMGAEDCFLHMVYADLLITSKSSFSYKPALLSNGIKICPENFWHGYPDTDDWILVDDKGNFEIEKLNKQ